MLLDHSRAVEGRPDEFLHYYRSSRRKIARLRDPSVVGFLAWAWGALGQAVVVAGAVLNLRSESRTDGWLALRGCVAGFSTVAGTLLCVERRHGFAGTTEVLPASSETVEGIE